MSGAARVQVSCSSSELDVQCHSRYGWPCFVLPVRIQRYQQQQHSHQCITTADLSSAAHPSLRGVPA
jgi:hypothetical protein